MKRREHELVLENMDASTKKKIAQENTHSTKKASMKKEFVEENSYTKKTKLN